jgi:hypothetical protein
MNLDNLPRLITKQALGRLFDRDPRTVAKLVKPLAVLLNGEKEIALFDANVFVNLSVNLGEHPSKKSQPVL